TISNDASYSGGGIFSASGGVVGGGTISESGNLHIGDSAADNESIAGSGTLSTTGGSGSGTSTGSTSWSYSGSGSYVDSNGTSGIAFFVPGSGAPDISGSVSGNAYASGLVTGDING